MHLILYVHLRSRPGREGEGGIASRVLSLIKNMFPFQLKTTLTKHGHTCLDDVNLQDLKDIESVIKPLENLASKKDNEFVGSHQDAIDKITNVTASDTPLRQALKNHIREELLTISILQLIQKCKSIVTLFKTSGLNDRLEGGSLKQEIETRWMSILDMLRSFFPTSSSKVTSEEKFNKVMYLS